MGRIQLVSQQAAEWQRVSLDAVKMLELQGSSGTRDSLGLTNNRMIKFRAAGLLVLYIFTSSSKVRF